MNFNRTYLRRYRGLRNKEDRGASTSARGRGVQRCDASFLRDGNDPPREALAATQGSLRSPVCVRCETPNQRSAGPDVPQKAKNDIPWALGRATVAAPYADVEFVDLMRAAAAVCWSGSLVTRRYRAAPLWDTSECETKRERRGL